MINCSNVSKSFNEHRVLDNISFSIPEGTIVGLLGPSGAGKTTLIKILTGQLDFDAGNVDVMNKDVRKLKGTDKNRFGIMMDQFGLYERFTCAENLSVFADVYWIPQSKVRESLKSVGLEQAAKTKASNLSKGMRARLLLARAMMHDPKIIFLDEPTSGLDPLVRDELIDLLGDYTRDESHSILISSHIVSDLEKLCDYIAFLHKGKLMLCEEKDTLLERYGLLHTSPEKLAELDQSAIMGSKITNYGAEAIVDRQLVPSNFELSQIGIEDLFIFMAKERKEAQ